LARLYDARGGDRRLPRADFGRVADSPLESSMGRRVPILRTRLFLSSLRVASTLFDGMGFVGIWSRENVSSSVPN
jgi:hypothetical protein